MTYLINRNIAFNPENGSLKNIGNGREVFLSSLSARILHQLINAGPDCLRREALLEQAWQQHGLVPAPASLNQYISLTRRTLVSIGLQERLIITVAKTGYRLNNSISIEIIEAIEAEDSQSVILDEAPILEKTLASSPPVSVRKKTLTLPFIYSGVILLLLIISCLLGFFINKRYQELNKFQHVVYIGKINHCPIYFINQLRDKDQNIYLKFLATTRILAQGCAKDEVILAHTSRRLDISEESGHQFIAKCSIDAQGNYYHCENEYTTSWQLN